MSSEGLRIALFMPNLHGGGAERMMVTLANGFERKGCDVSFLLCKGEGIFIKDLVEGINVVNFNSGTTFQSLFKLISYYKSYRPDIMLSSLTNANIVAILAKLFSNSPTCLFLREASTIPPFSEGGIKDKLLILLMKLIYPLANNIIAISTGVKDDLISKINLRNCEVTVIHNPAFPAHLTKKKDELVDHPWLRMKSVPVVIAVGRLTAQKDFRTLIKAFAIVRERLKLRLLIVGEGEEYDELRRLASNSFPDDISFTGFVSNPFALMSKADVFVLSSRWEGFGNVLVEAMGCGIKVVSTDCPSGPAEILENGKWGLLVPVGDEEAMAGAIERQLESTPLKGMMNHVYNNFNEGKIVEDYLRVLTVSCYSKIIRH